MPQLEPKADLQEGEFTFHGTFCPRRRPSRVSSLYIYLYIAPRKEIMILESGKFMLVESGIPESWQLESGILGFRIQTTAQRIWSPTNDWNPESKFH